MLKEITGLQIENISDYINIYDSLRSSVSTDTKLQIASLLHTGNKQMILKIWCIWCAAFDTDWLMATTQLVVNMNRHIKLQSHFNNTNNNNNLYVHILHNGK